MLAKYSGDNAWYPARIASVGGSEDRRAYTVVFKGYNSTEVVHAGSVKALPANFVAPSTGTGKRKAEEEADKDRKKKKNEKKAEVRAVKAKEQSDKQASWMKFAKKSEKKGTPIAGLAGTSIFKSPDNPHGRGTWFSFAYEGCINFHYLSWCNRKWTRDVRNCTTSKAQVRRRVVPNFISK